MRRRWCGFGTDEPPTGGRAEAFKIPQERLRSRSSVWYQKEREAQQPHVRGREGRGKKVRRGDVHIEAAKKKLGGCLLGARRGAEEAVGQNVGFRLGSKKEDQF